MSDGRRGLVTLGHFLAVGVLCAPLFVWTAFVSLLSFSASGFWGEPQARQPLEGTLWGTAAVVLLVLPFVAATKAWRRHSLT